MSSTMDSYTRDIRKKFWLGLVGPVVAAFAVTFSFIGSFFCETVQFKASGEWLGGTTVDFTPNDVKLGPWYQKDTVLVSRMNLSGGTYYYLRDVCNDISGQVDVDAKWKTVRAFSIITPIIGGLLAALLLFNNCSNYLSAGTWKNTIIMFMVILPIFQGLSFLLLDTNLCAVNPLLQSNPTDVNAGDWTNWINTAYPNQECVWDVGMTMNVLSTVFYFITGCYMIYTGVPTRPPPPPPETQAVTYERQTNPDGTQTVVQTAVVKGTAVSNNNATVANSEGMTEQPVV